MTEQRINPEKVTKPIQLLAAWLVGLILVNASFLLAAQQIVQPDWASSLLVIAAVVNVPVFIGALFLLQTKFRPQMQEDSYYSEYLQREKYVTKLDQQVAAQEIAQTTETLIKNLEVEKHDKEKPIAELLRQAQFEVLLHKHGPTRTLSELFLEPDTWKLVVDAFEKDPSFIRDIESLQSDGLVDCANDDYRTARLTSLGIEIAKNAEAQKLLFGQRNKKSWEILRKRLVKN